MTESLIDKVRDIIESDHSTDRKVREIILDADESVRSRISRDIERAGLELSGGYAWQVLVRKLLDQLVSNRAEISSHRAKIDALRTQRDKTHDLLDSVNELTRRPASLPHRINKLIQQRHADQRELDRLRAEYAQLLERVEATHRILNQVPGSVRMEPLDKRADTVVLQLLKALRAASTPEDTNRVVTAHIEAIADQFRRCGSGPTNLIGMAEYLVDSKLDCDNHRHAIHDIIDLVPDTGDRTENLVHRVSSAVRRLQDGTPSSTEDTDRLIEALGDYHKLVIHLETQIEALRGGDDA
jgi:DNA repair ATPase RecN